VNGRRVRALVLGAVIAIVIGVLGSINASGYPAFDSVGRVFLGAFPLNLAGGVVTALLGAFAGFGAARGSRALVVLAGVGFAIAAAFTVVSVGRSFNVFGGHGSTASFFLAIGSSFLAIGLTPEDELERRVP
jgi:hypothetical protein